MTGRSVARPDLHRRTAKKNDREVPEDFPVVMISVSSCAKNYFFLAVAGFLVAVLAAGLAAPALAFVDFAAAGFAAPAFALVDFAAVALAGAFVADFEAVLFAAIPRFLHGDFVAPEIV